MAFEIGIVPKDWRSGAIVPLYKGKKERLNEGIVEVLACKTWLINVSLDSIDGVRRVTESLIDGKQSGFRAGKGV